MANSIERRNVTKIFDTKTAAVDNASFSMKRGEFFSLLGPSGCGKTTLLRIIAGFETPTSDTIFLDGKEITQTPLYKRNVNMVFQSYAFEAIYGFPKTWQNKEFAHTFINFLLEPRVDVRIHNHNRYLTPNKDALAYLDEGLRETLQSMSKKIASKLESIEDLGEATRLWDKTWTEIQAQ